MKLHILTVSFLFLLFCYFIQSLELLGYKEIDNINYTEISILERHTGCCLSLDKCSKLCKIRTDCFSFFYKNISQQCQLHLAILTSAMGFHNMMEWQYYVMHEDCSLMTEMANTDNGVFQVKVNGKRYDVFCDMTTDGGGWTVFQKRYDGSVDFYLGWEDYANGFGDPEREFWLGNEFLHEITSQNSYKLRIDMEDFDGIWKYAEYSSFSISSNITGYTLSIGSYSGTAGNSLVYHNGYRFATKDNLGSTNCAISYPGAWWYYGCHAANLNGLYNVTEYGKGINWYHWHQHDYSLKATEMKIKRT